MKYRIYRKLQLLLAVVFMGAQILPALAADAGHGHSASVSLAEKHTASNAGVKRCVAWEKPTAEKTAEKEKGLNATSQNCEGVFANCSYCNSALLYAHNLQISPGSKQYVALDIFHIKHISSKLYRPPKNSLS